MFSRADRYHNFSIEVTKACQVEANSIIYSRREEESKELVNDVK